MGRPRENRHREQRHKVLREMTDFKVQDDTQEDNFYLTINSHEKIQEMKELQTAYNTDE